MEGDYNDGLPLANITIAGVQTLPKSVSITIGGKAYDASGATFAYENGALQISNLESTTSVGIWSGDVEITLEGHVKSIAQTWGGNWGGGWGLIGTHEHGYGY